VVNCHRDWETLATWESPPSRSESWHWYI
jgi:hypothetical protein